MYRESNKITGTHLAKDAIVYIRQSTIRQVYENTESTLRQYGLKNKLMDLGWPAEQIRIIDQDLGKSGADSKDRDGFQSLVADVSNGLVGAVACIECSRLSRDSEDWIKLTKFCAFTNTLLIDADGVYNPNDFNDRLLLGLKGTMSEAELHFLHERMYGGLISKANRGELRRPLPVGYVYDGSDVIKDPDIEIQQSVELLFDVFRRLGSAYKVVEYFNKNHLTFPRRPGKGYQRDDEKWLSLDYATTLRVLHNPYYAGAFCYGRNQNKWTPEGKKPIKMSREAWHAFIPDHHVPYITIEEYEVNERIISENRLDTKRKREKTPPREGPSLIQGLVYCGKCGCSMKVNYQQRGGKLAPVYRCDTELHEYHGPLCQSITGVKIDQKIAEIVVERLTPAAIDQAINVRKELDSRQTETLTAFQMRVDKCEYEANRARKRYMSVDPDNRLVALQLEEAWNKALQALDQSRNEYAYQVDTIEKMQKERDYLSLHDLPQQILKAFTTDKVSNRDKKRIVRHLIEDVTLLKTEQKVLIQIRFKGETTQVVEIDAPLPACKLWVTGSDVIQFIDTASENHFEREVAELLNQQGSKTAKGLDFSVANVRSIMRLHSLSTMKQRLLDRGYITTIDKASMLGIHPGYLSNMVLHGKYSGDYVRVNAGNELLFPPAEQ